MEILYQDQSIVAVNKPSGLLSIPDGYHPEYENAKQSLDSIFGRVWTVHRLDKDTSGVILFALNEFAHRQLSIQFTNHDVRKEYYALAAGVFEDDELTINLPLKINGDRSHRTVVDQTHGKPALTEVIVVAKHGNVSSVKVFPKTGFTHQIRCHLAAVEHPIIGDSLYTKNGLRIELEVTRLALHAYRISFQHPEDHTQIAITAEIPEQLLI